MLSVNLKIKVCGLNNQGSIEQLKELPINFMGFIFYKNSPRFFDNNISLEAIKIRSADIKKVGVFVNEASEVVLKLVREYQLDLVQLHGNETEIMCAELSNKVAVIKAFGINDEFDFIQLENYLPYVSYFLFDTNTKHYGGSGQQFNWQKLNEYEYDKPFFLSGGIDEESQEKIKQLNHPQLFGIDLNSKFEIEPGIKDINKLKNFITKLKNDNN